MDLKLIYILNSGFYSYISCLIAWKIEERQILVTKQGVSNFPCVMFTFAYV